MNARDRLKFAISRTVRALQAAGYDVPPDVAEMMAWTRADTFGSEDQPRDEAGRWTSEGGGDGGGEKSVEGGSVKGFEMSKEQKITVPVSQLSKIPKRYGTDINSALNHAAKVSMADGKPAFVTNSVYGGSTVSQVMPSAAETHSGFFRVTTTKEGDSAHIHIQQFKPTFGETESHSLELSTDIFALRGTGTPGRKPAAITAVNDYQTELQRIYSEWSDTLADDLADADPSEQDDIIKAALLALLALLRDAGRKALPEAVALGLGDVPHPPEVLKLLAAAVGDNDKFLAESLLPDLEKKIEDTLADPDIQDAIESGSGAEAIGGGLAGMLARIGAYAGAFWSLTNQSSGIAAGEHGKKIRWVLDEQAQHCATCEEYGDTTYDSYEDLLTETNGITPSQGTICQNNCRCLLIETDEDTPEE